MARPLAALAIDERQVLRDAVILAHDQQTEMLTRLRLLTPSAVVNAAEALHDAEHARAHACFMDTLSDVVNARQTTGFDPFAVNTEMGTIHADRIAMHPRHWLTKELGQVEDQALATVRTHLGFLFS